MDARHIKSAFVTCIGKKGIELEEVVRHVEADPNASGRELHKAIIQATAKKKSEWNRLADHVSYLTDDDSNDNLTSMILYMIAVAKEAFHVFEKTRCMQEAAEEFEAIEKSNRAPHGGSNSSAVNRLGVAAGSPPTKSVSSQ